MLDNERINNYNKIERMIFYAEIMIESDSLIINQK